VIAYAESSAVICWILDEPRCEEILDLFSRADAVTCSALTLLECDRVLRRGTALGSLSAAQAAKARRALDAASSAWSTVDIGANVLSSARRDFPAEPVRSLDALHLGMLLMLRETVPDLALVTLDGRIAANASLLGFPVLPR
jgi:uncharacterized protein with PIN domain